ncbi:MAG: hypothetical protein H0T60_14435 [Acidobacteria bacterium]|nr:hypothetical protein [Acidobacteriota bacterium]
MKVAVFCESPADEAAIRILLAGILEKEPQAISWLPRIATRPKGGWSSVKGSLPNAIRHFHYNTDADALVVVADSDDTPVHRSPHDQIGGEEPRCRLSQLRNIFKETKLRPIPDRSELKSAVGIAVPAIEAWYLCDIDQHVSEATWERKLEQSERITYTRNSLKKKVYGTERATLNVMTRHAIEAATRLVNDLSQLENSFPVGFGSFARDVRNWQLTEK